MRKYKCFIIFLLSIIYTVLVINFIPKESNYTENDTSAMGYIISYQIDGNQLKLEIKAKEKLMVYYYFNAEEEKESYNLEIGDYVVIEGIFSIPNENTIFNLFNYKTHLLSKKINYVVYADKIDMISKNSKLLYKVKQKFIDYTNTFESKSYLNTLVLGEKNGIAADVNESYQINGITHLFSISGMHISLLIGILLFLIKKFPKVLKIIVIILFILFYTFLTNYGISVLRAGIFFILKTILKKEKSVNILYLTTAILLFINPYSIYNLGFQFSVIITFFIIQFSGKVKTKNKIVKSLIISSISFFASMPICINNYFQINILSIIYNLFFIPFVTVILYPLTLITLVLPFLDKILLFIINIMEEVSLFLSTISFGIIVLSKMNSFITFLYYILIYFIINNVSNKKYWYYILIILTIFIHSKINYFKQYIQITFIDVGQGDCTLLQFPDNQGNVLIDTGGKILYDEEQWKIKNSTYSISDSIVSYLKSEGITKLHYMVITHGDYDHMGEAINLVENFKVEKVIFNCGEFNDLENELIKVLDKKKIPYYSCIKELNIDNNKLYFLNNKNYDNENDNSSVIYTEFNNYKFLFMGDAGVEVEEDLIEKYNLTNIDVLKVGHHGSKTSSGEEFIESIKPKYSIISVGKNNRYGHPNDSVLNNLEDSKIYRTDQDGSIMFKIKNNKLQIETCAP